MSLTTVDDVRLSRRDVTDGALRILRVAGVPFGEAKRAAVTVEHLEIHRGCGAAALLAAFDRGALAAGSVDIVPLGERVRRIDAVGTSGVVLATRIGDLLRLQAGPAPRVLRLPGLLEPSALEPAMLSAAISGMVVVAEWPTDGGHEVVLALPAADAGTPSVRPADPSSGPALARVTLPGPSGVVLAADEGRAPTPADLSSVVDRQDALPGAVLIALSGGDVADLDVQDLLDVGLTVESGDERIARTEQATRRGLRMPAALWHRFAREAKRWLVPET
jgi:hypothetical protein